MGCPINLYVEVVDTIAGPDTGHLPGFFSACGVTPGIERTLWRMLIPSIILYILRWVAQCAALSGGGDGDR
jgi:hypothetical protein